MSNGQAYLDQLCAQYGYDMKCKVNEHLDKNKTENLIAKSLGVLLEEGVYAFFLYLASQAREAGEKSGEPKEPGEGGQAGRKPEQKAAAALARQAAELLRDKRVGLLGVDGEITISRVLEAIRKEGGLADNLDRLLLAKRLLEQALIYACYHAKALEGTA
ncbi:MAG: hypothetical protein ACUVRC_09750 [Desulfotomaculales bacterium]